VGGRRRVRGLLVGGLWFDGRAIGLGRLRDGWRMRKLKVLVASRRWCLMLDMSLLFQWKEIKLFCQECVFLLVLIHKNGVLGPGLATLSS
jgi:hypothetical protein